MTFSYDGNGGTPSLFVQAANTWYNLRDTYIVRFVAVGCRKNLSLANASHLNGQCQLCGSLSGNDTICSGCADEYGQRQPLSAEFWTELDRDIFANRKLPGMKFIAGILDGGLKSAIRIYAARYDVLREAFPDSFPQSHDEYWAGFSS